MTGRAEMTRCWHFDKVRNRHPRRPRVLSAGHQVEKGPPPSDRRIARIVGAVLLLSAGAHSRLICRAPPWDLGLVMRKIAAIMARPSGVKMGECSWMISRGIGMIQ